MNQIGKLAQSSGNPFSQVAARNHQAIQISLFPGRPANQRPQRKNLARGDENTINLCGGQPKILNLISLQLHVNSRQRPEHHGHMTFPDTGKRLFRKCFCEMVPVKPIPKGALAIFFPKGNLIAYRPVFAKQLSAFPHLITRLSRKVHLFIT